MAENRKGFTLVELMIVLAIIAIVATLAIVNLSTSEQSANESAAIKAMSSLVVAEQEHKRSESTFVALADLENPNGDHRVPKLEDGEDHGYTFADIGVPTEGSYAFSAVPNEDGKTGTYTFIVNESGTVYKMDTDSVAPAAYPADPIAAGWTEAK